VTIFL